MIAAKIGIEWVMERWTCKRTSKSGKSAKNDATRALLEDVPLKANAENGIEKWRRGSTNSAPGGGAATREVWTLKDSEDGLQLRSSFQK